MAQIRLPPQTYPEVSFPASNISGSHRPGSVSTTGHLCPPLLAQDLMDADAPIPVRALCGLPRHPTLSSPL